MSTQTTELKERMINIGIHLFEYGELVYKVAGSPRRETLRGKNGDNTSKIWKKSRQYDVGKRIYSNLTVGYNLGEYRYGIGIDAPWLGDFIQGGLHSIFGTPLFDQRYDLPTKLIILSDYISPYSLYSE